MRDTSPCRGRKEGVALLHDVIEDSDITAEDLLAEGIPAEVVEAVRSLTKREGEDYMEFVARAKQSHVSRGDCFAACARNDMWLTSLDEHDLDRIRKYHCAWRFLKDEG